jgi:predicted transcriptional regulator
MKQVMICMFSICCFFASGMTVFADEKVDKTPDKGVAAAITEDAREIKKEAVKAYQGSKEAIVRDVQQMKEDIPNGLKEVKDSMVQHSGKVKESVKQEFKEIKDGMSKPLNETKSGNK